MSQPYQQLSNTQGPVIPPLVLRRERGRRGVGCREREKEREREREKGGRRRIARKRGSRGEREREKEFSCLDQPLSKYIFPMFSGEREKKER